MGAHDRVLQAASRVSPPAAGRGLTVSTRATPRTSFPRHAGSASLRLVGAHPCAPTASGRTFEAWPSSSHRETGPAVSRCARSSRAKGVAAEAHARAPVDSRRALGWRSCGVPGARALDGRRACAVAHARVAVPAREAVRARARLHDRRTRCACGSPRSAAYRFSSSESTATRASRRSSSIPTNSSCGTARSSTRTASCTPATTC